MAKYTFSSLTNGQHLTFNPEVDELYFGGASDNASAVSLNTSGANLGFTLGNKTVWLDGARMGEVTLSNVTFANGGVLLIGDGTTGLRGDWYGQDYSLGDSTVGNQVWGLGGADIALTGSGADLLVGNTALTALNHVSRAGSTGSPNGSFNPTISADGQFVAFDGGWTGFGSEDDSAQDVLVKNLTTGTVTNEHKTAGGDFGLSGSGASVISADGAWLAFTSSSALVPGNPPSQTLYVASTTSSAIEAASTTGGGAFANGPSDNPDISADGRYVVFESRATNLAGGGNATYDDIFVKDLDTGAIERISTSLTGGDANADCSDPKVSADGRFVVFSSAATNLSVSETGGFNADIYVWDRVDGSLTNITAGVGGSFESLSPDVAYDDGYGGVVVFQTGKALLAEDTSNATDIYAFSLYDGTFQLVSTRADGSQVGVGSQEPSVSGDGRWVVFRGFSDQLVDGDSNGYADIFVKDLYTGAIALVSDPVGGQANQSASRNPEISLGGDWIVFESSASNLAGTDDNGGLTDVFRVSNPLLVDTLQGGAGNDTYVIARADVIIEQAGAGRDTVQSSINHVLGSNLENLTLTGTAATGVGNALANVLAGNGRNNTLTGLGGNDTLDGAGGRDTMKGGAGNDAYFVNFATDVVTELADQGTDLVNSAVSCTLTNNVENLQLTGTAASNGAGNTIANSISGNGAANTLSGNGGNDTLLGRGGADVLRGGAGKDSMTGGAGADAFVFNSALNANTNVDRVADFTAVDDVMQLDNDFFTGLALGALAGVALHKAAGATMAHDSSDRIIYNTTNGSLYFDADGNAGGSAAIMFATLAGAPALAAADFFIVD